MDEPKIKTINFITNELHDSITEIWEDLMDEDVVEANKKIDKTIEQLKDLKRNIVNKEE